MNELEKVLNVVNTFNASAGGIVTLVAAILGPDGTLTPIATLDEADRIFAENDARAKAWLDAHPKE